MAVVAGVDFGTLSLRVSLVDSERGLIGSAVTGRFCRMARRNALTRSSILYIASCISRWASGIPTIWETSPTLIAVAESAGGSAGRT